MSVTGEKKQSQETFLIKRYSGVIPKKGNERGVFCLSHEQMCKPVSIITTFNLDAKLIIILSGCELLKDKYKLCFDFILNFEVVSNEQYLIVCCHDFVQ